MLRPAPSPLLRAVARATAVLCAASALAAATVPAALAQGGTPPSARSFDIPAGPLLPAVTQYAQAAGLALSFDAAQLASLRTEGLRGSYTVQAGFAQLLQGSGLRAVAEANGSYSLRAAPSPAPAAPAAPASAASALAEVKVVASAVGETTEGTGSYTTRQTRTATKLALSPRETPQSVSVLTREQMDVQGLQTLDDAIQTVTGLVMQKGYYAGNSGQFSARGFEINNLMVDGLATGLGGNGTANTDNDDLAVYDRIEVVRGATGLLSGSGTPSASVNLVRKRPTAQPQAQLSLSAGSWDNYRWMLDGSRPLNAAGTLRGRAVVTGQGGGATNGERRRAQQVYGIVEADLGPDTLLTLGAHYRSQHTGRLDARLPANADGSMLAVPRSTNLGNAFDRWDQRSRTLFGELEHRFAGGWTAKLAATQQRPEADMLISSFNRTNGELHQGTQAYRLDNRQTSWDASLTGPFTLLGRQHELVLGASHRRFAHRANGGWAAYTWNGQGPLVDPFDWDASSTPMPAIDMAQWRLGSQATQSGAYAVTRLQLAEPLKLILGARLSWYESQNLVAGSSYKISREVTPYAGLVFDLDRQHSVYTSWTRIFQPQNVADRNGRLLDPITGTNLEAGIKGEYFGGRLNASLAVFQIEQQNRPMDDTEGPNPCPGTSAGYCKRAAGEVRSRGVEAELSGELLPRLQAAAGYTYVSAIYTRDTNAANVGQLYDTDYPRHQLKLSASYQLPGELQRWRVGGNLYAQNGIYNNAGTVRLTQGGYTLLGLSAAYQLDEKTRLRLNVANLLDKRYYAGIGWLTGGSQFGAPRSVTVTLDYRL